VSGGRRWSFALLRPPSTPVPAASPSFTAAQAASPPSIPTPATALGAWTPMAALTPGNPPTVVPPSPQDEGKNGEVREGRALTRNSIDCSAGPEDDKSTTRSKMRWPELKKTASTPSIADTLGQFLWRGVSWRRGRRGRVLGWLRGQPEQRRGGVLFDSDHRSTRALPASPFALSVQVRVLHRHINGGTSISSLRRRLAQAGSTVADRRCTSIFPRQRVAQAGSWMA
jgi:hypothetical protein